MTESPAPEAAPRAGILTTDTDLVVKSWDAALERMTGISAARARGQRLDVLVPDLTSRVPADLLRQPLLTGAVQVLAPALHGFLIPCRPSNRHRSSIMQQRVVIGALRDAAQPVGLVVTIEGCDGGSNASGCWRALQDVDAASRFEAARRLAEVEPVEGIEASSWPWRRRLASAPDRRRGLAARPPRRWSSP